MAGFRKEQFLYDIVTLKQPLTQPNNLNILYVITQLYYFCQHVQNDVAMTTLYNVLVHLVD